MKSSTSPQPIRTDRSNEFAHRTMADRVPDNIREIRDRNPELPKTIAYDLEALEKSVRNDDPIPPPMFDAFDRHAWESTYERLRGDTWLDAIDPSWRNNGKRGVIQTVVP